jgi:competence protein ComEC
MKRPLLPIALLYVSGILAACLLSPPPSLLLASSLSLALACPLWARARPLLLATLIVATGWTNTTLHTAILSPHDLRRVVGSEPALVTVRGVLHETPSLRVFEQDENSSWRTLARVDVSALCVDKQQWQPATGRLAVTSPGMLTNLFASQAVEVFGVMALPKIAVAEGTFDYRAYLEQLGIYYQLKTASPQDWRLLSSPPAPPLADRFRNWARQALARGLPAEDESLRLEWALTLGWKPALTEEVCEPFVRAATYHIFAVDGLRMAIIFGIFFGLLRALAVPRPLCGAILLPLIWFYVALTNWPASAIRATVMLTVIIVGWVLNRPSDLLNSLFAAALIILVWQPQQLFQAGFQLSFFVVLCLILMLPPLYELVDRLTPSKPLLPERLRRHWPPFVRVPARYVGEVLLTSFAAWVGSLPLVAYYFNIITPVSTPANLLAVPLCALVLISNLSSLLLASWFPAASELFNHAGWFLMECIRITSHWFARGPGAYFYVPAPNWFAIGLYYAVLLALVTGWLFRPALRRWKFGALALAVSAWGWTCWQNQATTRLTVLPVNGGMAIYHDTQGSRNDLLVDTGPTNCVQFTLKPFLRAQGVNRLPRLVLTHGDVHHVGGAIPLVEVFTAGQVCASPARPRSPAYRKSLDFFNQNPGLVQVISRTNQLGDWTVLHPDAADHFPRADDNAIVLAAAFNRTRILLLSDLGRAGQDALLERVPDLQADIVVTGLPSVGEPLCDTLLDAIQPKVIIVADSEFPASERARPELRERLESRKVPVIYTRFQGATTIELRAKKWEVRTMNGFKLSGRT